METAKPDHFPLATDSDFASRRFRDIAYLCGICAVLLVPFLNRPLHIDDPLYIWIAQHIRQHPFDFYGFNVNWERQRDQPISVFFQNPPFAAYFFATVSLVTGFDPLGLHVSVLAVNLLTVAGMYLLAGRFCRRPFLATLVLILCPGFLVSANTLMCEPILLCAWIWAILLWTAGSAHENWKMLLGSSLFMLIAVLSKFLSIGLIPLLVLYSIFNSTTKSMRWVQALALSVPVLGGAAYEIFTSHRYGAGGVSNAMSYVANVHTKLVIIPVKIKVLNSFAFVGGCAASCVGLLPFIFRRWITAALVLLGGILVFVISTHFLPPDGWSQLNPRGSNLRVATFAARSAYFGQYVFWGLAGLGILVLAIVELMRSVHGRGWMDEIFLLAWITGIFAFTAFFNWSVNGRTILPLLPAVCILVVRALDAEERLPRYRVIFSMLICGLLAVTVADADYNFACTVQSSAAKAAQFASQLREADVNPDSKLWFFGHWGFQYYMQQAGAYPVDVQSDKIKAGDFVIYPDGKYGGVGGGKGFINRKQFESESDCWVATSQTDMGAGFYASFGYQLPFIFGPVPHEVFNILQATHQTRLHP